MSKAREQALARQLRQGRGMSVKEIARELRVAPSSVSRWVRDVPLTAAQTDALRARNPAYNSSLAGFAASAGNAREARLRAQHSGRLLALADDPLHHAGCMLYWAEGTKDRNRAILTNTDPDMLEMFVRFLRKCYDVADERFCFSVNCFLNNGLTLHEIETWWLRRLGLPASALRKATVNRPSRVSKGVRPHLPYGTARVVVNSTAIVQSIYGAIQEYAGIERPEWLDCRVRSATPP